MSQFSPLAINSRIAISILIALLFTTIPLPVVVENFRPLFVPLIVLYWSVFHPLSFGLGKTFLAGLLFEASQTLITGQAALGLICISVFALASHRRIQLASVPQQMLTITGLLLAYQFIQIWIESFLGRQSDYSDRFITVIISAIIWPAIIVFMRGVILNKPSKRK